MSSKCWQWIIAGRLEPQFVAEHLAIDERQLARVLGTGVVVLRDVREEADIFRGLQGGARGRDVFLSLG